LRGGVAASVWINALDWCYLKVNVSEPWITRGSAAIASVSQPTRHTGSIKPALRKFHAIAVRRGWGGTKTSSCRSRRASTGVSRGRRRRFE